MQHHEPKFHFCPVCGGKLTRSKLKENEPTRLVCSACDFVFYLDPKVVACTMVELDGKVVLLKRAIDPQKGKWVMPGGYVDRKEKVESAAVRETLEECGLRVGIKGLLGVYSYRDALPVVIVYTAEAHSGDLIQGDEAEEVRLFTLDEIPWGELAFRSTRDAIKDYYKLRGKKEKNADELEA